MSGHRWSSLLVFCCLLALIGCQSDESRKRVWNPFRRTTAQANSSKEESPFSLPGFPKKDTDEMKSASAASDPDSPVAEEQVERLLTDGQLALQEDRLDDARRAYTQVLTCSPDNATAHHGLAMAADLTQQWADAEYHYRQALRIRPRDANLLCDIGYSYLLQNRYSEASRYLNHAVEVNPQHESAQMNLALLDLRQGNRSAAQHRITARFGVSAEAAQVMAQLDSQTGVDAASFKSEAASGSLASASFEQVQEMARQERVEAERRRASPNILPAPPNGVSDPQRVAVLSNQNAADPGTAYAPAFTIQPGHAAMPNPATMSAPPGNGLAIAQPSSFTSPGQPLQTENNSALPGNPQNSLQPKYSHLPISVFSPGVGGANHPQVAPSAAATAAVTATMPQSAVNGPQPQVNMLPQSSSPATPPLNGPVSYSASPPAAMPQAAAAPFSSSAPVAPAVSAPSIPAADASANRIIPVHSTGTFQTAHVGSISYGQPLGFQPGTPGNARTSAFANNFPNTATPPQMSANSFPAPTSAHPANPPVTNASQPIYLDGLNAGPGTMFPIGQSTGQQPPAANGTPSGGQIPGGQTPQINMNNVSSPGTNSLLNGAFYAQPDSSLPAQEWSNQQQQQLRAQQLQSQLWQNQQRQGTPVALPSVPGNPSGPSPFPARPAPLNPLEAYERQRQELDTEYNKTLQQMDRQNGRTAPQFP
jgi:Flp pilus assembly protein TadD